MERTARRLLAGTTFLVGVDAVGGLLAVAADVNTWSEAWSGQALLAAPLPMIGVQVVLTAIATRRHRMAAAVAAGLLSLACLVSAMSAFFDGALGSDELSTPLAAFQLFLLATTAGLGVLAAARVVAVLRSRGSASGRPADLVAGQPGEVGR